MPMKPSPQQVQILVNDMLQDMTEVVKDEHTQTLYKIEGWFRKKFKVNLKTTLASEGVGSAKKLYGYGKTGVRLLLNLTLKNIPGIAIITGIAQALYSIVEYGVDLGRGKAYDYIVKALAAKGIQGEDRSYLMKKAMHKYMADQGITKIRDCVHKLQYASGRLAKPVTNCNQFMERLTDFAWFEYRVERLRDEILFLKAYVMRLEEEAAKLEAAREPSRKGIRDVAQKLIEAPEDLHHQICGELCLLPALYERFPQPLPPTKPLPRPHGMGRPLPSPGRRPTKSFPH